jgi:spore coat polysaccharide biosynthesis protein SpsF
MRVGILITARLKSTRLKEKVIKPIMGRPMLSHMLDRLRLVDKSSNIIICTSTIEQDDRLYDLAMEEGVECYRGHPDDVLHRMNSAAKLYGIDIIISCTADNPFVDPVYINKLIDFHVNGDYDFSSSKGLPFGTFAYALKKEAVERACNIKDKTDTEVWGGYFTQTGLFKCGVMKDLSVSWENLRLTVDTQEDFNLIIEIFSNLYKKGKVFPLEDIVSLCRRNTYLTDINAKIIQAIPGPIKLKSKKEILQLERRSDC